jgi:spermidine synthase
MGEELMTREQMIEELVEYEFQQVTMVEIVQMYIKLQREFMDQTLDDDEVTTRYNQVFGDAEVVH